MALINTTTTGVLGTTVYGDGAGALTVQKDGVTQGIYGNIPAFQAYPSVTQTFTGGAALTKVLFDTKVFDTNNNFANSRFTPTVAGYYCISASMVAIYPAGETSMVLYKNGSQYQNFQDIQGAYLYNLSGTGLVYMNGTTDYLEIYNYHQNSVTNYAGLHRTYFQGFLFKAA